MGSTVIHSAELVDGVRTPDSWIRFENGRVAARGTGGSWRDQACATDEVVDAGGRILTPGFIDLHGHGAGTRAFDEAADDPSAIAEALAVHRAHGTTRAVLSLVTAPVDALAERLRAIRVAAADEPMILGAHLEGPFLDHDFRGAHDPALLRSADAAAIDALLEAGDGMLRQVTIAPEHEGAGEAIDALVAAGVRAAVGHTSADFDTALRAFDRGASILTHAFNGMRGIHHRAPGPVTAAMRSPHVTLEVINDGVHVHPDVVALAFHGAPGRVAMITDAMAAAGAPDGAYLLGSLAVEVIDGVARLTESGTIAGSTLTLDAALRQAVGACGLPLETAVSALTRVPAAVLGLGAELGRLDPGYAADAVLLDADLAVARSWIAGA
ncbi:N-acetylglucosamine-6-phosphate deacetylase [Leucobacter iarius]|uniref:N-acetylglucosamine-6-phosphate deacetylase n=1 Tax=Leucobacter iarius TaxID=333963 RepID=A0ABP4XJ83_9MICO